MPRKAPRPYTRWQAEDSIRDVDGARALLDRVIQGMITGAREDEQAASIIQARKLLEALRDRLIALRNGPDLEEIVEWIFNDETLLCLIVHRLESE